MFLYIDTANHKNVEISILSNDFGLIDKLGFSCEYQFQIKDKLLKEIDKILVKNRFVLKDLDGIIAANKSKEMTSLRIGISTVNCLAYCLNIPIFKVGERGFGKCKEQKSLFLTPIKPQYEMNPMLNE